MAAALVSPCYADLTLVAQTSLTRLPDSSSSGPQVRTVKMYFHDNLSRIEEEDGSVLIFDNDAGKVYQLLPSVKSYHVESIKDLQDFKSELPQTGSSKVTVTEETKFDPSTDTAKYLNASSTAVSFTGDARVATAGSGGGRRGGGHRRFGLGGFGFPGGGGGGYGGGGGGYGGGDSDPGYGGGGGYVGGGSRLKFPVYEISGEIWSSDTYPLPKEKHVIAQPFAVEMLYGGGPFLADIVKNIDARHDIPLHSEISVVQSYPDTYGDTSSNPPDEKLTVTFDVQTVSNDPVDPALFQVPHDYMADGQPLDLPQLQPKVVSGNSQ